MQTEKTEDDNNRLLTTQAIPIVVNVLELIIQRLSLDSADELDSLLDKIKSKSPSSNFEKEEKLLKEVSRKIAIIDVNTPKLIVPGPA